MGRTRIEKKKNFLLFLIMFLILGLGIIFSLSNVLTKSTHIGILLSWFIHTYFSRITAINSTEMVWAQSFPLVALAYV